MVNTTYISTEDMIFKLKQLKGKTKSRYYKNLSNYYDEMNFKILNLKKILLVKVLKELEKFIMKYCC